MKRQSSRDKTYDSKVTDKARQGDRLVSLPLLVLLRQLSSSFDLARMAFSSHRATSRKAPKGTPAGALAAASFRFLREGDEGHASRNDIPRRRRRQRQCTRPRGRTA